MATSRKMTSLIAKSSLGSPAARALRARTPRSVATRIVTAATRTPGSRGSSRGN
ncbi:MAG: hypothetical protein QOI86_4960 [Actinomycetota bacterium]|jgi:hypothetical protein|nr:hypothetical protein [Actinomycetota bacterium]